MREYLSILKADGAKSLLLLSFITRMINIPLGALFTVISFEISGSWLVAGISGAAVSLAAALSAWLSGIAMDFFSPKKVLLLFAPLGFSPLILFFPLSDFLLVCAGVFIGILRPPSATALRTSWQRLFSGKERLVAYGLDAFTAPIAGALGALFGGLLLIFFSYKAIILFLAVGASISTLLLAFHPSLEAPGERKSEKREKLPLGVFLAVALVGLSWGGLVGLELLVGGLYGPKELLFTTAFGSVAVSLGALSSPVIKDQSGKSSLYLSSLAAAFSLFLICAGIFFFLPVAFLGVFLFGLSVGVISVSASTYLSTISSPERRSEALSLYASGVLIGQAIYRPLSGAMLLFAPALILLLPGALFVLIASWLQNKKDPP